MELKIDNASIEKLVQEQIRVAVAGVLSKQSDYLVGRLVDKALNEKRNSYDQQTILEASINEMIRKEAHEAVKEWLDGKRADIRKLVHAAISKKDGGLLKKLVDQLVLGLAGDLKVIAYLSSKD